MTEEYELSRRQARRITTKAMDLIVKDFEEINIERPQMVVKLLVNLEQGMQKGLINNQSSGVAACARQIISLAGLALIPRVTIELENLIIRITYLNIFNVLIHHYI